MGNPFPCVFMQAAREEEHRKHIAELVEETASLRHEKNETEQSILKISFPCLFHGATIQGLESANQAKEAQLVQARIDYLVSVGSLNGDDM